MFRLSFACILSGCLLTSFVRGDSPFLRSGETALRHQLYEVAEDHFQRVLNNESAPEPDRAAAALGVVRSRLAAGRLTEAAEAFPLVPAGLTPALRRQRDLVEAELMFQEGRNEEALGKLDTLPAQGDESDLTVMRLRSRTLMALGRHEEAEQELGRGLLSHPDSTGLKRERAELAAQLGDAARATALWRELSEGPMPSPDTQMAHIRLTEQALRVSDTAAARRHLDLLLGYDALSPSLNLHVYPLAARVLRAEGKPDEAAKLFLAWEKQLGEAGLVSEARIRRAHALILSGEWEEGRRILRDLIALRGDHPLLATAWLTLAESLVEAGQLSAAAESFEEYLTVFTSPEGQRRAMLGLAQLREAQGRWMEADVFYQQLLARLPEGAAEDRNRFQLKSADMLLAQGQHEAARARYLKVVERLPGDPRVPRIRFQAALALGRAGSLDQALDELAGIRFRYPDSEYAERALLEQATILMRFLRLERALGVYDAYLERYPQGSFVAHALTDKGLVAYRLGIFDLALRQFDEVLERFPDHARAEQAFFLRGWALYFLGHDEDALRVGQEFLQRFPDSSYRDDVRFWLAEHALNRGNAAQALTAFRSIAAESTQPSAVSKARYLAGHAAFAQGDLQTAIEEFREAVRLTPEAPHAAEALFFKGDALTVLNRFDEAIVVFEQLLGRYPSTTTALAARGRLGDCHFTLGEKDPARFQHALNAYRAVEESAGAPPDLRLQASYKIAVTLAALNRHDEALSQYLHVVYRFLENPGRYGSESEGYFNQAATSAGHIYEQRQDWRRAIQIYRHVVDADIQPASRGAEQRIQNLRREHLIFF